MAAPISTWTCTTCTFINDEGSDEADKCLMCQEPRKSSSVAGDNASDAPTRELLSRTDLNSESFRVSELTPVAHDKNEVRRSRSSVRDSISALAHMSFASWESDRKSWKCKGCTFVNEPRFLTCGGCGMSEGSVAGAGAAIEDELISLRLEQMDLHSAQEILTKCVHEQLRSDQEDQLRHERAVELLKELKEDGSSNSSKFEEQLESIAIAGTTNRKQGSATEKARKHIETLEQIQQAERSEHEEMLFTIEQWRAALREEPNDEQEEEMERQQELLDRLSKEWEDKGKELRQLRMRLNGTVEII